MDSLPVSTSLVKSLTAILHGERSLGRLSRVWHSPVKVSNPDNSAVRFEGFLAYEKYEV
jgi:hypothetical protein